MVQEYALACEYSVSGCDSRTVPRARDVSFSSWNSARKLFGGWPASRSRAALRIEQPQLRARRRADIRAGARSSARRRRAAARASARCVCSRAVCARRHALSTPSRRARIGSGSTLRMSLPMYCIWRRRASNLRDAPRVEHGVEQALGELDRRELLVVQLDQLRAELLQLVHLASCAGSCSGARRSSEGEAAATSCYR